MCDDRNRDLDMISICRTLMDAIKQNLEHWDIEDLKGDLEAYVECVTMQKKDDQCVFILKKEEYTVTFKANIGFTDRYETINDVHSFKVNGVSMADYTEEMVDQLILQTAIICNMLRGLFA